MTKKEKEEFFEYLKTLPDYKKIIKDYDPDIIYLVGSQATGLATKESDFDIVMKIKSNKMDSQFNFINIKIENDKNLSIHCMITTIKDTLKMLLDDINVFNNIHTLTALTININNLSENLIYNSGYYDPIITFWINNSSRLTELCLYNYLLFFRDELKALYLNKVFSLNPKIYYHLIMYFDELTNQNNKELAKKIKHDLTLSESEKNKFNLIINTLYNFYISFDYNNYIYLKTELEEVIYGTD